MILMFLNPFLASKSKLLCCCSLSSTMDEFSAVDELSVILMFLNPFLAKLPEEAREGLCRRMSIENINRDRTIYKQGEEVPNFYLILSGELHSSDVKFVPFALRPALLFALEGNHISFFSSACTCIRQVTLQSLRCHRGQSRNSTALFLPESLGLTWSVAPQGTIPGPRKHTKLWLL